LDEKCSKHEALKKATELVGLYTVEITPTAPATMFIQAEGITKSAVLSKAFTIFKNSLPRNPQAVEYLKSRSLDYSKNLADKQHETGFIKPRYPCNP
jgi:hypothetical protein